jgi:hypothetical protein
MFDMVIASDTFFTINGISVFVVERRRDILGGGILQNDTRRNDIQLHNAQRRGIPNNDTQHHNIKQNDI